jgi:hypothetical protein
VCHTVHITVRKTFSKQPYLDRPVVPQQGGDISVAVFLRQRQSRVSVLVGQGHVSCVLQEVPRHRQLPPLGREVQRRVSRIPLLINRHVGFFNEGGGDTGVSVEYGCRHGGECEVVFLQFLPAHGVDHALLCGVGYGVWVIWCIWVILWCVVWVILWCIIWVIL